MMRPSRETCKSSGSCTGRHTQTEKRCTSATTRYSETWQIQRSCQNILQEVWKRASSTWNLNNTRLSIFQLRMGEWKWEKDDCTFSKWFIFNDEIQHQTSAAIRYNAKHVTCNFFFQHPHPHEPYASLTPQVSLSTYTVITHEDAISDRNLPLLCLLSRILFLWNCPLPHDM